MPTTIGNASIPLKPPRYWVAAKRRDGLADAAIFAIWWKRYTVEKRLLTWIAAPDEEWSEHGLRRPTM